MRGRVISVTPFLRGRANNASMLDQYVDRIIRTRVLTNEALPADVSPKSMSEEGIC